VHAELRLELLNYLTSLGATAEELVAYQDMLPALAAVLAIRSGPVMTLAEAANESGLSLDELRRLTRAAGLPDPEPGARVFTEGFVAIAAEMRTVAEVFGEDTSDQLLRVLGSAMALVADAVVSAFLVNVGPAAQRQDPAGLGLAHANVEAAALLPLVAPALDTLLRQHLLTAQRMVFADTDQVGYETQDLVVGFVDLVGSTELGEQLSIRELGAALTTFEHVATDTVIGGGGRVVKLIGDEIMYTALDASSACTVALDLVEVFRDHPIVPPVRAGLAGGQVMLRDGDVFGPMVNLAARTVKVAHSGEVLATADVAIDAGLRTELCTRHLLKGIAGEVELFRIIRE
jgi:adenylate cyclase